MIGILLIILLGLVIFVPISIVGWGLDADIYFLSFKLEDHPKILKLLEDTLYKICDEEGVKVFNRDFLELNEGVDDPNERAVGRYIYTTNPTHQERCNNAVREIEELERNHKTPVEKLSVVEQKIIAQKESLTIPRIELCKEYQFKNYGQISYFGTFFHELGHHFAAKTIGEHNEEDADKCALHLIQTRLPRFYQLFMTWHFEYRIAGHKGLTRREKILGYIDYFRFNRLNK